MTNRALMTTLAIIQVDLHQGRFGHTMSLLDELAGKTILQHTLDRVACIKGLDEIILLHPAGQSLNGTYSPPNNSPLISVEVNPPRNSDTWLRGVIDSGRNLAIFIYVNYLEGLV